MHFHLLIVTLNNVAKLYIIFNVDQTLTKIKNKNIKNC
jgi:hypothetical protein